MRPPRDMNIIEIDITNACAHRCSNCTRFCGYYKKPYFMDEETFHKAVDSLKGFQGTVSLMGGEPTMHPKFQEYAEYLNNAMPEEQREDMSNFVYPQKDFLNSVGRRNIRNMKIFKTSKGKEKVCVDGAGMFSSLGDTYLKNYECIQSNLSFQGINDHSSPMYHQPVLISRKFMGISDEEWKSIRDKCWVNNLWSASITPKGCFFCEIAGTLDMLFEGDGGLPIENGWWNRDLSDFEEQFHWCEYCGLALKTFSRNANDEINDVSYDLYEKLKKLTDRNLSSESINVISSNENQQAFDDKKYVYKGDAYSNDYESRFDARSSKLFPKDFEILYVEDNLGTLLVQSMQKSTRGKYLVFINGNRKFANADEWKKCVINPGTLHVSKDDNGDFIALFNSNAQSLQNAGFEKIKTLKGINDLISLWNKKSVVDFDNALNFVQMKPLKFPEKRFVLYGAGNNGELIFSELSLAGAHIVAVVDSDSKKWSQNFHGYAIKEPNFLIENRDGYDSIVISSTNYYSVIKGRIIDLGLPEAIIYKGENGYFL